MAEEGLTCFAGRGGPQLYMERVFPGEEGHWLNTSLRGYPVGGTYGLVGGLCHSSIPLS